MMLLLRIIGASVGLAGYGYQLPKLINLQLVHHDALALTSAPSLYRIELRLTLWTPFLDLLALAHPAHRLA